MSGISALGKTGSFHSLISSHGFDFDKSRRNRGQRKNNNCDQSFQPQIGTVVQQGINRNRHIVRRCIASKKYDSRQKRKKESAKNSQKISPDKAILFIRKNTGKPQRPKAKDIVRKYLGNADNIRVYHQLQNPVCNSRHQSCPQAEQVSNKADEQHAKQSD